jgi:hypothetical protein
MIKTCVKCTHASSMAVVVVNNVPFSGGERDAHVGIVRCLAGKELNN